ncbi:MAG TPA: sulfite exporter TauE/SafE family protein [Lachnospiraceae bacterium]|jgi:Predicted permeases|nr:sulfite exporter TauE/SafE family protein [Lachnospiraceae bacterium]
MMYVIIGLLSGIISGMGIGGGAVLIPALCFFMNVGQQQAQSINLLFFIPTAVVAIIKHKKEGNIDFSLVKPVIIFGIVGAVVGSLIAVNMDGNILRKLFGGFLLFMGIWEIFKKD